jgi:hypothetical protein
MNLAGVAPIAVLAMLLASGCSSGSPPPALTITAASYPPLGGLASSTASVPVGIALELLATPTGFGSTEAIALRVDDPTRASISQMATDDQFVLTGLAPGSTTLRGLVNGQEVISLDVEVPTQPAQP